MSVSRKFLLLTSPFFCFACLGGGEALNLVDAIPEDAGDNCLTGGIAVNSGLDDNLNGILDDNEIDNTQFICNAENTLFDNVVEGAGDNCAAGGIQVLSGIDVNLNGVLDEDEIDTISFICNGEVLVPIIRQVVGIAPADLVGEIDNFKADLGGNNNGGVAENFADGFRQINWDGVPVEIVDPNFTPGDFFNQGLDPNARGLVSTEPGEDLQVEEDIFATSSDVDDVDDNNEPTGVPVEFASFNATHPDSFQPFSNERLFAYTDPEDVTFDNLFFLPADQVTPASVKGFGVVFSDVDIQGATRLQLFGITGNLLIDISAPALAGNESLSFIGVSFVQGFPIARARITVGNTPIILGDADDDVNIDIVVMDDFIYGEPQAIQ